MTPVTGTTDDHVDNTSGDHPAGAEDPVTGTTDNATGEEQAKENEQRDPVG